MEDCGSATKKVAKRARTASVKSEYVKGCERVANYKIASWNRFLFRDDDAFKKYEEIFKERRLATCYCFEKKGIIKGEFEKNMVETYIKHWKLEELVLEKEGFSSEIVRIFYANLKPMETGFASYMCGKEIEVSVNDVAQLFKVPNQGHQVEVNKIWRFKEGKECNVPNCGPKSEYVDWYQHGKEFSTTRLPALHRFVQMLVSNVVLPKGVKPAHTLDWNTLFFMRHLIALDEIEFNIAFMMVSHIHHTLKRKVYTLPFGHIIHRILKSRNCALHPKITLEEPVNIWEELPSIGWFKEEHDFEEVHYMKPTSTFDPNSWITWPGAKANQYTNPWSDREKPKERIEVLPMPTHPSLYPQYLVQQVGSIATCLARMEARQERMEDRMDRLGTNQKRMLKKLEVEVTSSEEENASFEQDELSSEDEEESDN